MPKNIWTVGTWNVICDVCGFRYKANQVKQRWDGLIVCDADFEERHPSDLFRAREEKTGVPFTRPEPTDTFVAVDYIADTVGTQENDIPESTFESNSLYTSDFTTSTNTNLNAFGAPDWYLVRASAASDIQVIASTDNVQLVNIGQADFGLGLVHTLIGSINDYEITATVRRATGQNMGMVGVRCGGLASSDFYMVGSNSNNDLILTRLNSGGSTILQTTAAEIPANSVLQVGIRVRGSNPVVLEYSIGTVSATYNDTSASRHTTGPPGVFVGNLAAPQADVWVDNVIINALP